MNIDKKYLSYMSASIITMAWIFTLTFLPSDLNAEGSVDFINNDGYRLFYFAERPQQLKVYASEGEFINLGASHVGIASGFIKIYRPDGSLHSTFNNTGTSAGLGIIQDNVEELNGPTGGGTLQGQGYTPGIVEVDPGEAGIWTVTLGYGFYQFTGFDNLLNNQAWSRDQDQPTNRRVVLSWDITVSQSTAANDGGNMITGRVFTKEYQSIVSGNGNMTSPTYYLLTNEGLQFKIDYNDVDPWGFQINSNNKGIITGDNVPTYSSFKLDEVLRSENIASFDADKFYLYEPQARDTEGIFNNKVFFNTPDPSMPATALVTDIVRNDTHTTWLFKEAPAFEIEILDVALLANDPATGTGIVDVLDRTNGALITYKTNLGGNAQLVIDIDNDGLYGNNNDRIINAVAINGENQILWDGLDEDGLALDQQFNRELSYRLRINAGELHLTLTDVENDIGGVTLTRLNGNAPSDEFLYDHSRLGEALSGDGVLPEPTSEPFTFSDNFGDLKILDYWTYVASVSTISELLLDIVDDVAILPADTDGDGIRDDNDIDDDNDGILDALEVCAGVEGGQCFPNNLDPDFDEDFDGIPNYIDADDAAFDLGCIDQDGDGRCDQINFNLDIDQDGIPNHLDLDADNDGIVDMLEANHNVQDQEGNGVINADQIAFGKNGLFNALGTDDDALTANTNYQINDADIDLHPDAYDLDADNDGIFDVAEANLGQFDTNGDGILSRGESNISINDRGLASLIDMEQNGNVLILPFDNDEDQIYNFRDRDSDNDGLSDAIEGRNPDSDGDGVVGDGAIEINDLGVPVFVAGTPFTVRSQIADHDNDTVEDYRDLDSDNDGIFDVAEALLTDTDNNGFLFAGNENVDQFGLVLQSNSSVANYLSFAPDNDGDSVANYLDRDSDNDGIHDIIEGGNEDPEGDGVLALINTTDVNALGLVVNVLGINVSSFTNNNDGDNLPDYLDLDADNDGINDVLEGGNQDADNDGVIGFIVNEYGQFILNNEIATTSFPKDKDGDGVPNYHDLDSDNDGINDVVEGGNEDPDNDGVIGVNAPETDDNGQVIGQNGAGGSTSFPIDTDGDGIFDYEDLDSDDDGIFDVSESNLSDEDNDGTIGSGQIVVNEDGQVLLGGEIVNTSNPTDTDGDGVPDFRDLDSDNDELDDELECPNGAPCPDVNQSGEPDYVEFSPLVCPVPLVQPTVEFDNSICSSEMLSLTVNESDEYESAYPNQDITYTWTNANGAVIMTTIDPNYTISGEDPLLVLPLMVVVSVDVDCVSPDSDLVEVDITPTPPAVASSEFDRVCIGGEAQLFVETVDGASYQWFFNTFPFSAAQNPIIQSLNQTTNFGVVVRLNGCSSDRTDVMIFAEEPAVVEAISGAGDFCAGDDIVFTAVNNNPDLIGNLSYVFSGPDGLMVDVSVPADGTFEFTVSNVDFINGGAYSLIVDNGSGCASNTETFSVSVSEGPEQPDVIVADNNVCEGENISFTTQMYEGPDVSYAWMLNGTIVSTTSVPSLVINNAALANGGNYSVEVSAGVCGTSTSAPVAVSIVDTSISPSIENNLVSNTACTGQSVNLRVTNPTPETIYTWFGPNNTVIATDVMEIDIANIQMVDAGNYRVEANVDGCVTLQDDEEIIVAEGLFAPEFENDMIQSCSGQDITLTVNNFTNTGNTTFNWFDSNDNPIAQTLVPNFTFVDASTAIAGGYYVMATEGECISIRSETIIVDIINPPTEVAFAGANTIQCESAVINLNATAPTQGIGTWTSTTGNIVDVNNPTTQVNNLPIGDNMFIWILDANGCTDFSRDTVVISVSNVPLETATILNTETSICATEINNLVLSADAVNEGLGQWTLMTGPNTISFTSEDEVVTGVNGLIPGSYTVGWTLSTAACGTFSNDTYTFTVDEIPSENADAGLDQSFCDGSVVITQATAPSQGAGQWSSSTGLTFSDVNDPNATVTGLAPGNNTLTWTLSSGSCQNYANDVVNIEISTSPNEQATVTNNSIRICDGMPLNLSAIMPSLSDGNWTQVLGVSTDIMSASQNETLVDYPSPGNFTYEWVLSTADCGTFSSATVDVTIDVLPNEISNAGTDIAICGNQVNLSADAVTNGNGFWTSTSGNIFDANDPNTMVTGLTPGDHTFIWTLSNGVCENYSNDEVIVSANEAPSEVAQVVNNLIELCADESGGTVNLDALDPVLSNGLWTQMSGPSTITIENNTLNNTVAEGLIAGQYQFVWTLSLDNCIDFSTDMLIVNVDEIPFNVFAEAGENQNVCSVNTTNLNAEMPPVGTGIWTVFSTNGANINDATNPATQATLMEGENIFVWSLSNGGCENYQQDTVRVFFANPEDAAVVLTNDIELCESNLSTITLNAGQINAATGTWTQVEGPTNVTFDNQNNEEVNITSIGSGNYTFQWTLSEGACIDFASDIVNVNISAIPNEEANVAQDEVVICGDDQVLLNAVQPIASTGIWNTEGAADILNSDDETTLVNNLQPGANTFTWSLSNGNCINFSSAEVTVFMEEGVEAIDDNFTVQPGITTLSDNLLDNENFNGNTDWTIALVGSSSEVTLDADGTFTFTPENEFSGEFTFEYEICDVSCNTCERALVSIDVLPEPVVDCVIPNVLTPNNDNKNDALIIECAIQFEDNILQIFNRWGDKVYGQVTYQNDWRGTYQGDDLPAGTYFYVFKKDLNETEALTGYITIIR